MVPSAVPEANATASEMLRWLYLKERNRLTQTATTATVLADDGTTAVASATVSDDGTTFVRGEFS